MQTANESILFLNNNFNFNLIKNEIFVIIIKKKI